MQIQAIRTERVRANTISFHEIIDKHIIELPEDSIVAISSKIVSLCEGNVVAHDEVVKDELIIRHTQHYLPRSESVYGTMVTIVKNSLMLAAGIDESNSDGMYVLWPKDPLGTAKSVYEQLRSTFGGKQLGVLIVDSTSRPLRIGTIGTSIAHWGFEELNDYRGSADLFGREMTVSQANIAESLAIAAVLTMGEGAEQTPLAIISGAPFVHFNELGGGTCYETKDALQTDVYWPALKNANWRPGKNRQNTPESPK